MSKPKRRAKGQTSKRKVPAKRKPSVLDQHKARAADDLVIFAIRLTQAERDLIHTAAGPGRASRFVRAVAIAAARKDQTTLSEVMKETTQAGK